MAEATETKAPVVTLGRASGLKVSALCLGCMNFGESTSEEDSRVILRAALDSGVFFWDTADVYSDGESERILGRFLQDLGPAERDQVVVATKANGQMGPGPNDRGLSRRHLRRAVEESLQRLQTDHIDLYQAHRYDPSVPFDETLETFDTLVREGKIRYWGTSTFASWQMAEAHWRTQTRGWVGPVTEQAPYNLLDRRIENDRAGFLKQYGWAVLAWSPLAGGQLAGRYRTEGAGSSVALPAGSRVERMGMWRQRINASATEVAQEYVRLVQGEYGLDPAQAAVAWVRTRPTFGTPIIPIVGPRTLEQFTSLLPSATLELPAPLLAELDGLVPPGTAVADFHNNAGWQVGRLPGLDSPGGRSA